MVENIENIIVSSSSIIKQWKTILIYILQGWLSRQDGKTDRKRANTTNNQLFGIYFMQQ